MPNPLPVAITFDVDMTAYAGDGGRCDERAQVRSLLDLLALRPHVKTTWFIRLDDGMQQQWGEADWFFKQARDLLDRMRASGHEVAWHHHACRRKAGKQMVQEIRETMVLDDLQRHGAMARQLGLTSARMGWSFHTNATMHALARLGFACDSSAMPRPRYPWESTARDWDGTPRHPYHPATTDYRRPGRPELPILEIPLSIGTLPAPTDTQPDVQRVLNLAYQTGPMAGAFQQVLSKHPVMVTVTHPYEMFGGQHALFACHPDVLLKNIDRLESLAAAMRQPISFTTVAELAGKFQNPQFPPVAAEAS